MKHIILAFAGVALLTTGASEQTDPEATFYACRARADAERQRALSLCQPNPRDPQQLQRCRTRAGDTYARSLERCASAHETALRRADERAREAERRAQERAREAELRAQRRNPQ